jgi:two-component system NarL family response regulator
VDGADAVHLAIEAAPDVVLMDLRMPGMSGIVATSRIRDAVPAANVIVLTSSDADDDLFDAIRAGATGYLLKDVDPEEIAIAVRRVHSGDAVVSPAMASRLLGEFAAVTSRRGDALPRLTRRELEVLRMVGKGLTNREVAKALWISENTVKNHVRNVLEKLHVRSKMEAVLYALRERLLTLDDA